MAGRPALIRDALLPGKADPGRADIPALLPPGPRDGLLDILIAMTSVRDPRALEVEFSSALSGLFPNHAATTFCVDQARDGERVVSVRDPGAPQATAVLPLGPAERTLIDACLDSRQPMAAPIVPGEGHRWIALPRGADACQLVLVTGAQLTDAELRALETLTRVYCNCAALINDNQRDMLTGLLNRRSFEERVGEILALTRRGVPFGTGALEFAVAVLDIDHFKRVNDQHGHVVGDEILLLFANLMRTSFRSSDLLFRFGGEEFVVVLSHTNFAHAGLALDRFREGVADYAFPQVGRVTVSIGYTHVVPDAFPGTLVGRADQALYYAKGNGRNRVASYEELVMSGVLAPDATEGEIELF